MKSITFLIIVLVCAEFLNAQTKFGNKWIISPRGYSINFNTTPVTHDTTFVINSAFYGWGHSNICDSNENIVFSSDGMDVFQGNNVLMDAGDSLAPKDFYIQEQGWSEVPQTSLILPMESRKYYLVTPSVSNAYLANVWANKPALNWNYDLLLYDMIDMNANAGAGKVIKRKLPLLESSPMKKTQMMACRHSNGKDWWLLKMAGDSNLAYTFLFTQDSVYRYPNQYIPFVFTGANDLYGQMQFSQDGKKWATTCDWATETTYAGSGEVFVGDFDRCTGQLSNYQKFVAPSISGDSINLGLSFSPNGKLLYVSKFNYIQQLDLDLGTWYTVHGPDSPAYFCGYTTLHLAPDNKIYIGRFDGICKQLSVIDSPDVKYNCAFCVNCLRSKSVHGYFTTPPNMPNYELGTELPCWPLSAAQINAEGYNLEIFPNPVSGKLYIKTNNNASRKLYNAMGQLIQLTHQNEIDVSKFPKGIYYLQVGNEVKKVIVE